MPWQRASDEGGAGNDTDSSDNSQHEGGDMGGGYDEDDEEYEEYDEYDEEENTDPEEGEDEGGGSEPDPAEQARISAAVQRALEERLGAVRGALQEQGFDLSADGRPLIADPAKVAAFAGALQAPAARTTDAAQRADGDEDEEIPDSVTDPAGHRAWVKRQVDASVAAAVGEVRQRQAVLDTWHLDTAKERAVERFKELAPGTNLANLGLSQENAAAVLQAFRSLLDTSDPQHWTDDNLLMLGAAAVMKVMPKSTQPKDSRGRFASQRAVNATVFSDSWEPHPDAGRTPRESRPSREEAEAARAAGMSVGTWRTLQGPNVSLREYEAALAADERAKAKK